MEYLDAMNQDEKLIRILLNVPFGVTITADLTFRELMEIAGPRKMEDWQYRLIINGFIDRPNKRGMFKGILPNWK